MPLDVSTNCLVRFAGFLHFGTPGSLGGKSHEKTCGAVDGSGASLGDHGLTGQRTIPTDWSGLSLHDT